MEGTVGIPHGEIHVGSLGEFLSSNLTQGVAHDFLSAAKRGITPVFVTESSRQETGTIESTIELGNRIFRTLAKARIINCQLCISPFPIPLSFAHKGKTITFANRNLKR